MRIDPWASRQYADYARLRDEFGIEPFDAGPRIAARGVRSPLLSRGVVFGHRGFDRIERAIERGQPWALLTGLMPSGNFHLGHKMVMDQVRAYQELGADVTLAVADIEAYATRGMSLERAREIAIDQYVRNYLALGLDPERAQVYFQSRRAAVKDLAWKVGRKVNWTTMQAIYGFEGETNMGHALAPLVQVGDILHVQLPRYGGPRPVLVPVGVDQDPHLRLTRDLADATRVYSVKLVKEGGLGVFVGPDDDVPGRLKAARQALSKAGFADSKENVAYKALYLPHAAPDDVTDVDLVLAKLESAAGAFGFLAPSATYHRFMTGLTGDKMSSSRPETSVFLTDDEATARKKVMGAKTGGRATAEEQRRLGAEWDKCVVAEMYTYHLAPDEADLAEKHEKCVTGARLCGPCKGIAADRVVAFLKEHKERRDAIDDKTLASVVRED
ncbi:MAG TPA: tryptophan--tRNA ligase [Candidatus Thermoplasmatota archaeon]|nr:tryptophan--tRNA ligase [Candidatus Thermoplasmatota archaeon]